MATPLQLLRKIEKINVTEAAVDTLDAKAREIASQQRDQLFQGRTSKGTQIKPKYRPRTIQIKKKKGQPTDRVTLKDTGDFHKAVFLDVRQDTLVLDSADSKAQKLIDKYDPGIFGLDKTSRVELKPTLQVEMVRQVKTQIING